MKKTINTIITSLLLLQISYAAGDTTFKSNGNPIIRHKFTADPAAMVHNGTVYLYTGHDEAPKGQARYVMHD